MKPNSSVYHSLPADDSEGSQGIAEASNPDPSLKRCGWNTVRSILLVQLINAIVISLILWRLLPLRYQPSTGDKCKVIIWL